MPKSDLQAPSVGASHVLALWLTVGVAIIMAGLSVCADALGRAVPLPASALLVVVLLLLVWFDFTRHRLPDMLTFPLIALGFVVTWAEGRSLLFAVCGGLIGYGLIWGLNRIWLHLRGQDGIGMGDAKLLAGAGTWLGLIALPPILLIASFAGLLMAVPILSGAKKERRPGALALPFGPALVIGFWTIWVLRPAPFI